MIILEQELDPICAYPQHINREVSINYRVCETPQGNQLPLDFLPFPFAVSLGFRKHSIEATDTVIDINIILPIIGGTPTDSTHPPSTSNRYKGLLNCENLSHLPTSCYASLQCIQLQRILQKQSHKSAPSPLGYHRQESSSTRTLEAARTHGASHLGIDIRLVNSDTSLYTNRRKQPPTSYHASIRPYTERVRVG